MVYHDNHEQEENGHEILKQTCSWATLNEEEKEAAIHELCWLYIK